LWQSEKFSNWFYIGLEGEVEQNQKWARQNGITENRNTKKKGDNPRAKTERKWFGCPGAANTCGWNTKHRNELNS